MLSRLNMINASINPYSFPFFQLNHSVPMRSLLKTGCLPQTSTTALCLMGGTAMGLNRSMYTAWAVQQCRAGINVKVKEETWVRVQEVLWNHWMVWSARNRLWVHPSIEFHTYGEFMARSTEAVKDQFFWWINGNLCVTASLPGSLLLLFLSPGPQTKVGD